MEALYEGIITPGVGKAEALRQAQLTLLEEIRAIAIRSFGQLTRWSRIGASTMTVIAVSFHGEIIQTSAKLLSNVY